MIRRLVALVALILVGSATVAPAALAQAPTTAPSTSPTTTAPTTTAPTDTDQPYLTLDNASPWVAPDGTWSATWTVAKEPPAGAEVHYTIHQPLGIADLRVALAAVLAGGPLGPSLQNEVETPLAGLRTDSKATLTIPIRSHSGSSDRLLVPNPGILPISIDLLAADGSRLQHSVLFLDRLPVTATHPALRVAARAEVASGPIVQPDGSSTITNAARQSLDGLIGLLRHQATVPITSTIDPELLAALKRSNAPEDASRSSQLRTVLKGRPVLRSTWAPVDLDSWASSGSLADLQTTLFAGQLATTSQTGGTTEDRIWPPDPTMGPGAVRALGELGVQHLILSPGQLEATKDLGTDPGTTRRVAIDGGNGLDALVDDPTLAAQLSDTTVSPGMSAHLLATELESIWFSTPADATPAVSLDLSAAPSDTAADVLDALAAGPNPTIMPTTVEDAFTAASAYQVTSRHRSTPVTRKLVTPAGTHNLAPLSDYLGKLRQRAAAYHATMADQSGTAPLDDLLWASQDRSLDDAGSRRYLDAAANRIDSDLAKIQPPPARSLTLTARTASLPINITNGLDRPVSVLLRFRGTRLGLRGGTTRTVRLTPGPHRVPLSVVVRTSGEFTMTVQMRTADNSLLLSESTVRIRSTVVSGVGVFLGGGALLFLVIWWAMSIRRDRRARAAGRGRNHLSRR